MVNWRMYKKKLYKKKKTTMVKPITFIKELSVKKKGKFLFTRVPHLMFSEVSKSKKKRKWRYKFISAENLFVF